MTSDEIAGAWSHATNHRFPSTAWSVILAATGNTANASDALTRLCEAYWPPIYGYIRRKGHSPQDSQDLTQEFFARVLEKQYFHDAQRERGRFRSFLLASVRHFLANEWDRERAAKRGGDRRIVSLDSELAEGAYRAEPSNTLTPEALFERQWAITLLDRSLARLRDEYAKRGRSAQFDGMKSFLVPGKERSATFHDLAKALDLSEGALKVAVHRLRRRYGDLVRQEIADTVTGETEIDGEVRYLLSILERV